MAISRMDLADVGSPERLIMLILKHEPDLPIPVPIEDLARQLDIEDIEPLPTDGFVGGLLTDQDRSRGIILVQEGLYRPRRRFTVAHELGHFLIPTHVPDQPGRFLCSSSDLSRLPIKEQDRRARMEAEANRFASFILIPPPIFRASLAKLRDPSLEHILVLHEQYGVSKEAMCRAYVTYHEEPVAIVHVLDGKVQRSYRNQISFPFIPFNKGDAVPEGSLYRRRPHQPGRPSQFCETIAEVWIDVKRGQRAPNLCEQVYLQQGGHALIMLHLVDAAEDEEEDDDEGLRESWDVRFRR